MKPNRAGSPFYSDEATPASEPKTDCALVTGGSRGIGAAICRSLAALNLGILVNYTRDKSAAESVVQEIESGGEQALACQANIAEPVDRERLLNTAMERFGRVRILVNNAGIPALERRDLLDPNPKSYEAVMAVNLLGPHFLTSSLARLMLRWIEEDSSFKPCIVFIGSISAYTTSIERPEYCISKAGLSMSCALYAHRLAPHGINVYELRPGLILTDMTRPVQSKYDELIQKGIIPQGRWGTPEDVGRAVAMLAQGCLPYSTGQVIDVDGGFHLKRL